MIEEKIKNYPDIELLSFNEPVKSVSEAVTVSKIEKKHFIKTIRLLEKSGSLNSPKERRIDV